jgi:zinc transport system substrate-binding protein
MQQTLKSFFCTFRRLAGVFILFILLTSAYADSDADMPGTIVVSIKPLYSLVAHLTEGISKPVLLMKQKQSPHHYNMRPSERRLLANAKMIIWTGPQMESYLNKIIEQQAGSTTIVSAMQAKNLKLLNKRNLHSHDRDEHTSAASSEKQNMVDPHIWLSTHNAMAISKHISAQLIRYNPENTGQYNKNLETLLSKIEQIKNFIKTSLKTHNEPFIAYHDAFQYFEDENALNYIDSINFNEETGASLKHMHRIKRLIDKHNIHCLVYQAPKPAIIDALISQNSVKAVALDPLGVNIDDDKNAWFELMRRLTLNFNHCLSS